MSVTEAELGAHEGDDPTAVVEQAPGEKKVAGKSPSRIAFDRLRKDKVAVVCAVVVVLMVLAALFAPLINSALNIFGEAKDLPYAPTDVLEFYGARSGLPLEGFGSPTADHPLGVAPTTGVDNFARLLLGLRTSLLIAAVATIVSTILGVVLGLVAGFSRGWVDRGLMFVTDLFLSFPFILGAMAMAPILRSRFDAEDLDGLGRAQLIALIIILVFFGWMGLARLIRGQVLSLREREFVQAAQVIGVPTRQILFKELLPNMVAPIIVSVSLSLPAFVTAEAGLSYLGIGLTGRPSLGQTIFDAQGYFSVYPLYLWAPVVAITILVLALNLLGDAIRDAFDPKTRR